MTRQDALDIIAGLERSAADDGSATANVNGALDLTVIYCTAARPCYAYAVNNKWIREFDAVVDALVAA